MYFKEKSSDHSNYFQKRNRLSKCGAFSVQVCDGSSYKSEENYRKSVLTFNMVHFQNRSD